uniref:USP domain-containing protein n=1 Tax=Amorphochlora amoebiformis TaxID=1561963 RepID=A0A7S0DKK3_9EUKA
MGKVWQERQEKFWLDTGDMKQVLDSLHPQFGGRYDMHDAFEFLIRVLAKQLHNDLRIEIAEASRLKEKTFVVVHDLSEPQRLSSVLKTSENAWRCVIARRGRSFFSDHTWGQTIRHTFCRSCNKNVIDFSYFRFLQVKFPEKSKTRRHLLGPRRPPLDLKDLLKDYRIGTKHVNWKCPGCKGTERGEVNQSILRLPDVLFVRLCRVKEVGSNVLKLNSPVRYPLDLDLSTLKIDTLSSSKFTPHPPLSITNPNFPQKNPPGRETDTEEMPLHPKRIPDTCEGNTNCSSPVHSNSFTILEDKVKSSNFNGPTPLEKVEKKLDTIDGPKAPVPVSESECQYQLFSVISHRSRSANRGHYVAHVRNQNDGNWYTHNDKNVKLKKSLEDTYRSVYVLGYVRKGVVTMPTCHDTCHDTCLDTSARVLGVS